MHKKRMAGFVFAAALLAGTASAEQMEMTIELSGDQQNPPVETDASGEAEVTFDTETRQLSWEMEHSGLSGDPTAAHFHGPADPGENAGVQVPMPDPSSGSEGSAELTEEQAEMLMDGKLYINVHTEANPNGEIRGQVTAAQ